VGRGPFETDTVADTDTDPSPDLRSKQHHWGHGENISAETLRAAKAQKRRKKKMKKPPKILFCAFAFLHPFCADIFVQSLTGLGSVSVSATVSVSNGFSQTP
jgi:hypothetical protein